MLIAVCECAGKCNESMHWPIACVLIALCIAGAVAIWSICKYS